MFPPPLVVLRQRPLVLLLLLLVIAVQGMMMIEAKAATVQGMVDVSRLPAQEEPVLARPPPRHELVVRMDGKRSTFVLADGTFAFRDVEPGIHEIQVVDSFRFFPKVVVEVNSEGNVKAYNLMFHEKSGVFRSEVVGPITLRPQGYIDYFEKRQQISILSFFMNPMFLIMAFTVGVGWLMPKMMEGLDPEERKAIERQQKDPAKMFQEMLGGGGSGTRTPPATSNAAVEDEEEEEENE